MSLLQKAAEIERSGKAAVLCTIVQSRGATPRRASTKMLVHPDGSIEGTIGGGGLENAVIQEALQALRDGRPRFMKYDMVDPQRGDIGVCGGEVEVYMEPILTPATALIIGGGHVGRAAAHLARWLGYRVVISDDRPEFCTPDSNPDADLFLPVPMPEVPARFSIDEQTAVILTTRGVDVDSAGLPALLATPAGYIGVIGSRRRWNLTLAALRAAGVPEEQLGRIHSPIGLDLGAETPEEIAVSIMAEVLAVRQDASGNAKGKTSGSRKTKPSGSSA